MKEQSEGVSADGTGHDKQRLYLVLGLLFLFLFFEMVSRGPAVTGGPQSSSKPTA